MNPGQQGMTADRTHMIILYSPHITNRLTYIAGLILGDMLGLDWKCTDNVSDYTNTSGPRINYSSETLDDGIRITPAGLIHDSGIKRTDVSFATINNHPVLFPVQNSDLPFDIFSASFYMVSRYEEYLPFEPDRHGRFPASCSIAQMHGFLQIPVVNLWVLELEKVLIAKYNVKTKRPVFRHVATLDVDMMYKYRNKGVARSLYGWTKDILHGRFRDSFLRLKVLSGFTPDPFDVFTYAAGQFSKQAEKPIFFIHAGDHGPFDKNIFWKKPAFAEITRYCASQGTIGIHPSYKAFNDVKAIAGEISRVESITGLPVEKSRQHYLLMRFPETYRTLVALGISEDYTLGYSETPGFRAGIAFPFHFYDLKKEEQTKLKIFPLCLMDRTFITYMKAEPDDAMTVIEPLIENIKKYDGTMVSLFHNNAITSDPAGMKWRAVFEKILELTR